MEFEHLSFVKCVVHQFVEYERTVDVELGCFVVFTMDYHSLSALVEVGNVFEGAGCFCDTLKVLTVLVPLLLHALGPSGCQYGGWGVVF